MLPAVLMVAAIAVTPLAGRSWVMAAPPPGTTWPDPEPAGVGLDLRNDRGDTWARVSIDHGSGRVDITSPVAECSHGYRVTIQAEVAADGQLRAQVTVWEGEATVGAASVTVKSAQVSHVPVPPTGPDRCQAMKDDFGRPFGSFCVGGGSFRVFDPEGRGRVVIAPAVGPVGAGVVPVELGDRVILHLTATQPGGAPAAVQTYARP
jgi:hypothetical protein